MEAVWEAKTESEAEDRADQFHIEDSCPNVTPSWQRAHQAFKTPIVMESSGSRAHRLKYSRKIGPNHLKVSPGLLLDRNTERREGEVQNTPGKTERLEEVESPHVMEARARC